MCSAVVRVLRLTDADTSTHRDVRARSDALISRLLFRLHVFVDGRRVDVRIKADSAQAQAQAQVKARERGGVGEGLGYSVLNHPSAALPFGVRTQQERQRRPKLCTR